MAITSVGYDGTVDEEQWAKLTSHMSVQPHANGCGLAVVDAATRRVSLTSGTTWGDGVMDTVDDSDGSTTKTLDAVSASGNRRADLIVLRRDWQPPGGATTVEVIPGVETTGTPVVPPVAYSDRGVIADVKMGYVVVDQTGITSTYPLIPYSAGGPLYWPGATLPDAADFEAGTVLVQGGSPLQLWQRDETDPPKWRNVLDPQWVDLELIGNVVALSKERKPQCRVVGGNLELSGVVQLTPQGSVFKVDGGVDQDYDLAHIPNPDWVPETTRSHWVAQYGQGTVIEVYAGFSSDMLQAHVYGADTGRITLDGISLRIRKAN